MKIPERPPIQPEKGPEIEREEIASLREPIQNLLDQMREQINQADYSLLIGDDASGRIPTLIFRKILGELYKDVGEKTPETLFVAGSGSNRKAIQGNQLEQKQQYINDLLRSHAPTKRALVITDSIYTGTSMRPLLASLRDLGYDFDVATLGTSGRDQKSIDDVLSVMSNEFGCEVFKGMYGLPEPGVLKKEYLSGVVKETTALHAVPMRKTQIGREWEEHTPGALQKTINQARKDAGVLAQELTDWYQSK